MEWIEVPIPASLASGSTSQILHYLIVNEKWSVYIMEMDSDEESNVPLIPSMGPMRAMGPLGAMGSIGGLSKWIIIFDGDEVSTGVLGNISSAKNVSMTVLNALMEGPDPKTARNSDSVIVRRKGSGN